jgi:hypothetical protein
VDAVVDQAYFCRPGFDQLKRAKWLRVGIFAQQIGVPPISKSPEHFLSQRAIGQPTERPVRRSGLLAELGENEVSYERDADHGCQRERHEQDGDGRARPRALANGHGLAVGMIDGLGAFHGESPQLISCDASKVAMRVLA